MSTAKDHEYFVPSDEVMTSIVLPTIFFCVGMVVAMLVGINKCKQWELDTVVEMRRTRRVVQRITARLREKNFNTIQKARDTRRARKRAVAAAKKEESREKKTEDPEVSPPLYSVNPHQSCGTSPPPSYEDALLDEFYQECRPHTSRRSSEQSRCSRNSTTNRSISRRRRASTTQSTITPNKSRTARYQQLPV